MRARYTIASYACWRLYFENYRMQNARHSSARTDSERCFNVILRCTEINDFGENNDVHCQHVTLLYLSMTIAS